MNVTTISPLSLNFVCIYIYIMAPEPISRVYFINPTHQSVYPTVVGQWLSKNVTAETNTCATVELLDPLFSVQSLSYQRKVGDLFFPELLVLIINLVLCM
jgi:hypothetical protein